MITRRLATTGALVAVMAAATSGCGWRGANSISLPGTEGGGSGSYTIQAQLPDVGNIQQNSRVRLGDVNVGTVTKIERQGWHAVLTMKLNGDVALPANTTAAIGQTSLLGSLHVELAAPKDAAPEGRLHNGSVIPLSSGRAYPTTEQTLATLSLILNGGGIGQMQDITRSLSTAFAGREDDLRSLIEQVDIFIGNVKDQTHDIIAATDSLNRLVAQIAAQRPVLEKALKTIPRALAVLNDQRDNLVYALDQLGKFGALTADTVNQTRENLVKELNDVAPVLESLADAGPAMVRSLSFLTTFPFVKENIGNFFRGDYVNLTGVFDLTLSRLDSGFFTGTRWEGDLTELEMQWGRTLGQMPSPYTVANPLTVPYRADQGR
ncbi:virulence factor Mce family protein [Mycolicibacterium vanbaalenii]|uniref:Virulence factor Mce family protein n=1 Tax=Mycolicibacterium vanbaalenii (strain DSM 7251 / JCM 13017 / BCRC 16820 / KCTC 9966 / NRRL B-24157 / PYR-1) TaxID=350058 RepID=A1T3L4_MYCVP|nr:virulence factor Mce family protein [Mycolicibacterium vanbaalenii]ABM11764.1 virulence factor Mce family protein [Mycolicibacterium vanbaalenii PYR-1]MCV7127880.1 virulence factor Mce family protein [Mycolicibacterium vanbaalenii PYR-1]